MARGCLVACMESCTRLRILGLRNDHVVVVDLEVHMAYEGALETIRGALDISHGALYLEPLLVGNTHR
jgi:hypothetical protein